MKAKWASFLIFSLLILSRAVPAHADDAKFKKLLETSVSSYLDQEQNPNPKKTNFFKSSSFQESINRAFCPSSSLVPGGGPKALQGRIYLPQSEEILEVMKRVDQTYINPDKFAPSKEVMEHIVAQQGAEQDSERPEGDFSLGHSIVGGYHQERFSLPPIGGGSSASRDRYATSTDSSDWQDRDGIRNKTKQSIADYFTHVPIFGSKIWTGSYDPPDPRHRHKHIYLGVNAQF
jgi:hypothetical protein